MELVATRDGDEGTEYLVVHGGEGYAIEGGVAQRVSVNKALALGSWDGDVLEPTAAQENGWLRAIEQLRDRELARGGRSLAR
jgi:hypothetical protein